MKKGMNAWGFPEKTSLEDMLSQTKEAGFDGIELAISENGILDLRTTRDEIKSQRDLIESYDLDAPSIASGLGWKFPLSSPEKAIRKRGMEAIEKSLQAASILGAKTVLVVPAVVNENVTYQKAYQRSQNALRELAPQAENLGVNIGIENVWNKFLLSPLEFRSYIHEVGSEYVRAYFDVGNVLVSGYPQDWIEILGDFISCVHVKDFSTDIGNIKGFTYLLQGDVNWKLVIKSLRKVGYDGYLVAELSAFDLFPEKMLSDTSSSLNMIMQL